jgi:hypothetical protein
VGIDKSWYLNQYDDVAKSGLDPDDHYAKYGMREGRHPSPPEWVELFYNSKSWIHVAIDQLQDSNLKKSLLSNRIATQNERRWNQFPPHLEEAKLVMQSLDVKKEKHHISLHVQKSNVKVMEVDGKLLNMSINFKTVNVLTENSINIDFKFYLNLTKLITKIKWLKRTKKISNCNIKIRLKTSK